MFDTKWLPAACGSLAPALIPPAHMLVLAYFWENYSRYVDKHFCTCSCWDTIFKGPYESGVASYKHLYFNALLLVSAASLPFVTLAKLDCRASMQGIRL